MSTPLASGGIIIGTTAATSTIAKIQINSGGFIMTANAARRTVAQMKAFDNAFNYCNERKGGPRSKIFCEVPNGVPHDVHAGSSKGRWYHWETRCFG